MKRQRMKLANRARNIAIDFLRMFPRGKLSLASRRLRTRLLLDWFHVRSWSVYGVEGFEKSDGARDVSFMVPLRTPVIFRTYTSASCSRSFYRKKPWFVALDRMADAKNNGQFCNMRGWRAWSTLLSQPASPAPCASWSYTDRAAPVTSCYD